MAVTPISARQTLGSTSSTLFTTGSNGSIITNIVFCNSNAYNVFVNISFNSVLIVSGLEIQPNDTIVFNMKQHIGSGLAVAGYANVGSGVLCHISGVNL